MPSAFGRRRFLKRTATGTAVGLAGCTQSNADATGQNTTKTETTVSQETALSQDAPLPQTVGLETIATGFEVPVDVAFAPDADRRYIADQRGQVAIHESDGMRDDPLLDLRDSIAVGRETGLLGIALHPDFATNRRLFVRYSAPPREGTPSEYSRTFVLAEFEVNADGTRVSRDSERSLLEIPEPQGNHNSGSILFGPDGYLYVGVGDGGAGGDQGTGHVSDWYDANEGGNGQDVTENLLGSVLRIDVDDQDDDRPYGIPDDNPLVGRDGHDEHYAWGFRNPWGMSFDGEEFFVADVGQSSYEEVNLVERGGNYGWNVKEGTHCYGADDCPDSTPETVRGGEPLIDPVIEYPHSGGDVTGSSVIGGHVYRGSVLPDLQDAYVFADLAANGRLFAATRADDGLWPIQILEVAGEDSSKIDRVYALGRDADGEVYVLGSGNDGGGVHQVVPAE